MATALAATAILGTALIAAGCGSDAGSPTGKATTVDRHSIAIDYDAFYAPTSDVRRLAIAHAKTVGARLTFSADREGIAAQVASLRKLTGTSGGFGAVVVAPFDVAAANAAVKDAARDVRVIGYLRPIANQATGITVDLRGGAAQTVDDARAAGGTGSPGITLLIAPPSASPVPDPLAAVGRAGWTQIVAAVRRRGIAAPQTVTALGAADARAVVASAIRAAPRIDTIITWNDQTAVGASRALGSRGYVGAFAPGGVTSAATLRALRSGGSLRSIVAPRLRDLAAALVDVPLAVLAGAVPAQPARVPLQHFTPDAATTRGAATDYAAP